MFTSTGPLPRPRPALPRPWPVDPGWPADPEAPRPAPAAPLPWGGREAAQPQPAAAASDEDAPPDDMPKMAQNAHENREAGCQKQQNEGRREERGQTATEQTENREQAQAVLLMFT